MGILDDAVSTAKTVADASVKKATELVELTKAKKKLYDLEKSIEKEFIAIGTLCYKAHKEESDVGDELTEKFLIIDNLYEKADGVREYIGTIKGNKVCAVCGKENPIESKFCNSCGGSI